MNNQLIDETQSRQSGTAFDPELARLLDQITARLIAGECLDLEALAREHREHAEALRELVPAMAAVAQFGQPELGAELPLPLGEGGVRGIDEDSPLANRTLGDFRIIREIGRGGMGVVYEAEQLSLGRRVALKVLPLAGMLDERQLQRFKNEARAAATLQHTNIVPVYAVGAERGVHFYAMQLVAGRSMAEVLDELRRAEGLLPPKDEGTAKYEVQSPKDEIGIPLPSGEGRVRGSGADSSSVGIPARRDAVPDLPQDAATAFGASGTPQRAFPTEVRDVPPAPVRPSSGACPPTLNPEPRTLNPAPVRPSPFVIRTSGDTVAAALPTRADSSSQFAGGIRKSTYIRSVVNLAIQAAGALDHAHAEGIMHRDIKPANLLLASSPSPSGRGRGEGLRLWVTDFGLARFQADPGAPGLTMTGDLVGTLRYMSPEQALAQRVIVDHRTDIYSLGVTLYELLTLRPTFDGADRQELLRQIAFDEPISPRKLNSSIPHDLETIVLKAIEKNPADRYATAHEFADDLEHFVRSEPIRAKRPTVVQRAAKWSRRHSALVTSCAVVLLLTTIGLTTAATLLSQAYYAESAERQRAEENLQWAWDATNDMYVQVAEKWLADEPQMEPLQREFLLKALTFFERYAEQEGDTPAAQLQVATAMRRAGEVHRRLGDLPKAKAAFEEVILRVQNDEVSKSTPAGLEELARAHGALSYVLGEVNSVADPDVLLNLEAELQIWWRLVVDWPDEIRYRVALAGFYMRLGRKYTYLSRWRDAEEVLAKARDMCRDLTERSPNDAEYWELLGGAQNSSGQLIVYKDLREAESAIEFLKQATESFTKSLQIKPRNPEVRQALVGTWRMHATALMALKRRNEAIPLMEAAVAEKKRLMDDFPNVPTYQKEFGSDLAQLGRMLPDAAKAHECVKQAVHHLKAANSANPDDIYCAWDLACAYNDWIRLCDTPELRDEKQLAQHEAVQHVLKLADQPVGSRGNRIAQACNDLAWQLAMETDAEFQQPARALRLAKKATELKADDPSYWDTLGTAYYRAGNYPEAIKWHTKAASNPAVIKGYPLFFLAMGHWQSGEQKKGREFFAEAAEWMEKNQPQNKELLRFRAEAEELLRIPAETGKTSVTTTKAQ